MTEAEAAWVAGIYEGEGCLTFDARQNTWAVQVNMTDFDVIRRLHTVTGIGHLSKPYKRSDKHKPILRWRACLRADVAELFERLYPWLGERRRAKVDEFRAWLAVAGPGRITAKGTHEVCYRGHRGKRDSRGSCTQCRKVREPPRPRPTHCPQNHPYGGPNRLPQGGCRACKNARSRERRREMRAQ